MKVMIFLVIMTTPLAKTKNLKAKFTLYKKKLSKLIKKIQFVHKVKKDRRLRYPEQ